MDSTVSRVILGLEALMRIPTGCGEQTIIHMAPTVSAMRYLNETQQMTPDIMQKGEALIRQGRFKIICCAVPFYRLQCNMVGCCVS